MTSCRTLSERKRFATLRAALAMHGVGLVRTDAEDGPQRLLLERRGAVWFVASLEHAEAVLDDLQAVGVDGAGIDGCITPTGFGYPARSTQLQALGAVGSQQRGEHHGF